jgi:hypothetical protein
LHASQPLEFINEDIGVGVAPSNADPRSEHLGSEPARDISVRTLAEVSSETFSAVDVSPAKC